MKKFKQFITLLLLSAMTMTSLYGCGNSESKDSSGAGSKNFAEMSEMGEEDTVQINVAFYCYVVPTRENLNRIETAINEITVPEIATEVHLVPYDAGSWEQQMNLTISSGEKMDLMPTFFFGSTTYDVMSATNQLTPLDDLLEEYGAGILDTVPEEYLKTTTYKGKITAIPCFKDSVSILYYVMNTDVLNELGLYEQAQNIHSMSDIGELLNAVKEKTDMIPLIQSTSKGIFENNCVLTDDFDDILFYDKVLNDYIIATHDEPNKVQALYSMDEFQQMCELFERWYAEGLINQDAPNSELIGNTGFSYGNVFSMFTSCEYSTLNTMIKSIKVPVTVVKVCDFPVMTNNINTNNWVIPVTATEPEAAMKFLNMMYTDKRIVDILNFGEFDVDYVINEDGTYGIPDGMEMAQLGYHLDQTFLFGNQFLAGVWEGDSSDIRTEAAAFNDKASRSPIFGFKATSEGMDTQLAGILSASSQYVGGLQCGSMAVDENLPLFREALDAAGIQEIVDNVQEQLDSWRNRQ